MVAQFEVYLINLDPTEGSEIKKTRPCVIISPNEMNKPLRTVIIAPLTTTRRNFPCRAQCTFNGKEGDIALDQMRAVDQKRLIKKLGKLNEQTSKQCLNILQEMFAG